MLAHESVQECPRVVALGIAFVAAVPVEGLHLTEAFCSRAESIPIPNNYESI